MTSLPVHVALRGVSKRFGGVTALVDVDLEIRQGSIHALVGENGAGKSTLGRMIAGVHRADSGSVVVDGHPADYRSPREALEDGVTIIAQELTLVPYRTVLENVFLGSENAPFGVVRRRRLLARFAELVEEAGFTVPPNARVGGLRVAEQQKVEVLRALAREARLIVMDEPTAALTADETAQLLRVMGTLSTRGTTIVFVSHFLDQVLSIADTITVLRDGRIVRTSPAAGETAGGLVEAMLGQALEITFPTKSSVRPDAPVVLSVEGLCRASAFNDVSFEIRAGEILGLAGLIGSGRTEVARAIFGADRCDKGDIVVGGERRDIKSPRDGVRAGLAMLPESRKDQGLLMRESVSRNVSLAHLGDVSRGRVLPSPIELRRVMKVTQQVELKAPSLQAPVSTLSGGNQQKTMFAKWLFRQPQALIADEPTRGIDVGAKRTIYELIGSLAADGMAVLLISSEIDEVIGLAHRILVMRRGEIVAEFDGTTTSKADVLNAAFATDVAA